MKYADKVNDRLKKLLLVPKYKGLQKTAEAAAYSLNAGGKRLRPELCLEICRIYGGDTQKALDPACAIEMMHTFSLIHDDLPCMDDDDLRRGKPSCHKAFGETAALLAGDLLAIYPFEVIADCGFSAEQRIEMVKSLSNAVGLYGMIGGQNADTLSRPETVGELVGTYTMKTAALIKASCEIGCICAGAETKTAEEYGENLGIAFQIVDDILDYTSDEKVLGKPVGSDKENGKATVFSLCGPEGAKDLAREYTAKALEAAAKLPDNAYITELTTKMLTRIN